MAEVLESMWGHLPLSLIHIFAVVLSTMMTTIVGQSIGGLSAMREQQAIAIEMCIRDR